MNEVCLVRENICRHELSKVHFTEQQRIERAEEGKKNKFTRGIETHANKRQQFY